VPRPPRADACRPGAQAVTFLVIHQKHKKSLEEITNDLCPVLSVQQLYRISTMYWDDRYGPDTVSGLRRGPRALPGAGGRARRRSRPPRVPAALL
jgi:hypothetical protein